MRRCVALVTNVGMCALFALAGCGGGGTDSDPVAAPGNSGGDPTPTTGTPPAEPPVQSYTPVPTAAGTSIGTVVSAVIGVAGGQLSSADGALTVEVPAGAFDADRTLAIEEITNTAHGAKGRAFRITPEGLRTSLPMTVRWRYTDEDVQGTDARALRIAYQDSARLWHVYREASHDASTRTLAVQTTHFSDWSLVAGVQLLPHAATVNVGQSVKFQAVVCKEYDEPASTNGDLAIPMVGFDCIVTPGASLLAGDWAVNGTAGGSARDGTIVESADPYAGNATYTAPVTKPTPDVVAVSAIHRALAQQDLVLVASVKILDDAATCDRLREVEHFDAEVSFDSFDFTAIAEDRTHGGDHQGRLRGRLKKVSTGSTFGFWTSALEPLQNGFVRIDDRFSFRPPSGDGYSGTFAGSGLPVAPSMITLKVDYATCTFDLHTAFAVEATTVKAGEVHTNPLGIGSLYLHDQTIPLEQLVSGTIEGQRSVPAGDDIDITNYVPVHDVHAQWGLTGSTIARWSLVRVP